MNKYRKRVDPNQAGIIKALEARWPGLVVCKLDGMGGGVPDLLVGFCGINILMEVKCKELGKGKSHNLPRGGLNERQEKWHTAWAGQCAIVWNEQEAIDLVQAHLDVKLKRMLPG